MGIYLVIEVSNGLILMWDRKTSLYIKLSPRYKVALQYLKEGSVFYCDYNWFVKKNKRQALFSYLSWTTWYKELYFFRVVFVGCVATMTTMQIMTSLQGPMLWWSTHWCLGTAGRIYQAAPMLKTSPAPAQPTHTDSPGPRNSAALYRVTCSLPATPL